jgi:sec-independent protein translocase protein TatB
MFDFAWSELMVIGAVALVVIGPKDLPKALKTAGMVVRRARGMAREFQNSIDDMIREAELEDVRKTMQEARSFNLDKKIRETIDPDGELHKPLITDQSEPKPAEAKPPEPAEPPALAEPFIAPRIPPAHE